MSILSSRMPAFKVTVFFLIFSAMCNARQFEAATDEDSAIGALHERKDARDETRKQRNSAEEETLNAEVDDMQRLSESHSNKREDDLPRVWERSIKNENQVQKIDNDLPSSAEQADESEDREQDDSPSVLSARNMAKRRGIKDGPADLWGRGIENGPPGLWGRGLNNGPPGLWGRGLNNGPPGLWGRGLDNGPPGLWGRGLKNGPPGLWGREARGTSALGRRNANGPPGLWGREIKNGPPGLWGRGLRSGAVGLWERELKNGPPGLWGRGLRNGPPGLWGREIEKVSKSSNRELSDVKSKEEDGNEAKEDIQEMK